MLIGSADIYARQSREGSEPGDDVARIIVKRAAYCISGSGDQAPPMRASR